MELLNFSNEIYPKFQAEGNASQFAIPYAKHFCNGSGYYEPFASFRDYRKHNCPKCNS